MVLPVIVGVGRVTQKRPERLEDALDPIDLAKIATEQALKDGGLDGNHVDSVMFVEMLGENRLPRGSGPAFKNPAFSLARRMGLENVTPEETFLSTVGGNSPQFCVNQAAERIANGEVDCCIVSGAEAIDTLMFALKNQYKLSKTEPTSMEAKCLKWGEDGPEPTLVGLKYRLFELQDLLHGLTDMPPAYALLDQAMQRKDGVSESQRRMQNARLFHNFSKIAEQNGPEFSWFPMERTVEEIYEVSKANRMVASPYSKLMCAIMDVNQAASIIVMSDEKAKRLGISPDKFVYIHGCADALDLSPRMIERPELDRCFGMKIVADATYNSAQIGPEQIDFCDIYSCFPVAVRMAYREFGFEKNGIPLEENQNLTVTGGLPFCGGPGNAYVNLSIVAMVEKLRSNRGKVGLVTANGGVLSKHSAAIYSTTVPSKPFQRPNIKQAYQSYLEATPRRKVATSPNGEGIIRNFTMTYKAHNKPSRVIVLGDVVSGTNTGDRFVAISTDHEILHQFESNPDKWFDARINLLSTDTQTKKKNNSKPKTVTTFTFQHHSHL